MGSFEFESTGVPCAFRIDANGVYQVVFDKETKLRHPLDDGIRALTQTLAEAHQKIAWIDELRSHAPTTPDDERSWIPALMETKLQLAEARAELLDLESRDLTRRETLREERDEALSGLGDAHDEIASLRAKVDAAEQANGMYAELMSRIIDKLGCGHIDSVVYAIDAAQKRVAELADKQINNGPRCKECHTESAMQA
jgi:hypothetical protein